MPTLALKMQAALASGTPAPITVADLLAAEGLTDEDFYILVSIDMSGTTPYAAANVFSALGVSAHETLAGVPSALYPHIPNLSDSFTVETVDFQVLPLTKALASISLTATLPSKKQSFSIGDLTLTVEQVMLAIGQPLSADRMVTLEATGTVEFAGNAEVNLRFRLSLPDCTIYLEAINPDEVVAVDTVLAAAKLHTDFFHDFVVDELDVSFDLLTGVASLQLDIVNNSTSGTGGAGFIFDEGALTVTAGSGVLDGTLSSTMTYRKSEGDTGLVFQAALEHGSDGWTLLASCAGADNPSLAVAGQMTIAAVLDVFGLSSNELPHGLSSATIDALQATATLGGTAPPQYTLMAMFGGSIPVGSTDLDVQAQITLQRSNTTVSTAGAETSGAISFSFDIDGFSLTASYQFGTGGGTFALAATYKTFTLAGQFVPRKDVEVKLTPAPGVTFGDLLQEIISLITGNPAVSLPEPFDVLNHVPLATIDIRYAPADKQFSLDITVTDGTIIPGLLSVDGFTLGYGSAKSKTPGFSLGVAYTFASEAQAPISFDPTSGSSAALAKAGLPLVQLNSVVAGQSVRIQNPGTDVDSALASAVQLVQPAQAQSVPLALPEFCPGGWILGAEMLIKQQLKFRFIFEDPSIYGASLTIIPAPSGAPGSAYLQALVGLDAEICYHRIDSSNGVYSATLALPHSANPSASGQISLPLCSVQIPSFGLSAYTDGDFLVDVGFPYGLDFSKSLTVRMEEYIGSGGVYFGRLSGADAPVLQGKPVGVVGTVTEVGVGLQIGIYYSENFGPLSGSLSLTAQGLFDGTFAEISTSDGSVEYYDIAAALGISGALSAEINFFIVSASLYIAIDICAQVTAIYKEAVVAKVWASVDVSLEATIDLGFFSIHKSFSFSATLSESFTISDGATAQFSHAAAALPAGKVTSLSGRFTPCPLTASVIVWATPVLTLSSENAWAYVLDFSLPVEKTSAESDATPDVPFTQLLSLVFGWFVYAYRNAAGDLPKTVNLDTLIIDASELHTLDALIGELAKDSALGFTIDDLTWLSANSLYLELGEPALANNTKEATVAAFPQLPGSQWWFDQVLQGSNGHTDDIARDYFVMLAHACVAYACRQFPLGGPPLAKSVTQIIAEMGNDGAHSLVRQTGGLTTRFMMHGNRIPATQQSAYAAANLESTFDPAATSDIKFVIIPANGSALTMASNAPQPSKNLHAPAKILTFAKEPDIESVAWRLLPSFNLTPHIFALRSQTPVLSGNDKRAGAIWRLPKALSNELRQRGPTSGFVAGPLMPNARLDAGEITPLAPASYCFATVIDFKLSKGSALSKANVYPIHAIAGQGGARLHDLVKRMLGTAPPALSLVELCYATATSSTGETSALSATTVDGSSGIYIYVENFSAESVPAGSEEPSYGPRNTGRDLLFALQARAMTDQGGFHLVMGADGLPDAAFDADGLADVSLVVSFVTGAGADGTAIASDVSALRVQPGGAPGCDLGVWSPQVEVSRPAFMPGVIGIELTVTVGAKGLPYSHTLNDLFHLAAIPALIAAPGREEAFELSIPPMMTSPLKPGPVRVYSQTINVFKHTGKQVTPYVRFADSGVRLATDIGESQDPYAMVGATVDIAGTSLSDIFGNGLPLNAGLAKALTPQTVVWADRLHAMSEWPGLTRRYRIDASVVGPQLTLLLDWVPPSPLSESVAQRLIQRYTDIYFQLQRIDATIESSIVDGASWASGVPIATQLQAYIAKELLPAIKAGKPASWSITCAPPPPGAISVAVLKPLTMSLVFALRADVPVGTAQAASFTVRTSLLPDQWKMANEGVGSVSKSRVTAFAQALESAFSGGSHQRDFKVMSGGVDEQGVPTYWLFRYGHDAFNLAFRTPETGYACASPIPLGTQYVARPAPGPIPGGAGGAPTGPMDLDASLRNLLQRLESFCSPDTMMLAERIERGLAPIAQNAKLGLAEVLSNWVVDSSTGAPAAPAAVDAYRQAMLKSLGAFYALDGALVYELQARFASQSFSQQIAIYGDLSYGGKELGPLSCSPISAVFDGQADGSVETATTFTVADLEDAEQFVAPHQFTLRAIKTDLSPLPVPPARIESKFVTTGGVDIVFPPYLDGTWLHFVIAPPVIKLPSRTVLVPLRTFPISPSPLRQSFSTSIPNSGTMSLDILKQWTIEGTYRHRWTPQDVVAVMIEANVPASPSAQAVVRPPRATPYQQLIVEVLALFEAQWNTLGPIVERIASGQASGDVEDAAALMPVIGLFQALALSDGPAPMPEPLKDKLAAAFLVSEGPRADGRWEVRVTHDRNRSTLSNPGQLSIGFAGYESTRSGDSSGWAFTYTRDGEPLKAAQAMADPQRLVSLADTLDVIGAQTGMISYATLENLDFAEAFHYQSAPLTLPKPVMPHVEHLEYFDICSIAGLPNAPSLHDCLSAYLTSVIASDLPGLAPGISVQLSLEIAYPSIPDSMYNVPMVADPIALQTAQQLKINATPEDLGKIVDALCEAVTAWSVPIGPFAPDSAPWSGLYLRVSTIVYAEWQAVASTPMLSLRGASIPLNKVTMLT